MGPNIPQLQAIQYVVFCHAPFHVCLVGEHKESGSREPLFFFQCKSGRVFPRTLRFTSGVPLPAKDRVVPSCSRQSSVCLWHQLPRSVRPFSQNSSASMTGGSFVLLHPLSLINVISHYGEINRSVIWCGGVVVTNRYSAYTWCLFSMDRVSSTTHFLATYPS